jgi:adenylate cyclase
VLFADCRDYTRLTQEFGIEKVAPVMQEFFQMSSRIIVGHDGIVDRLLGDGCMAFFNVPIKHDDHVARAVHAAFQIQQGVSHINAEFGGEFILQVGIGVATGLALVTSMGSTRCSDYTMVGDSINIASRLQSQAAPGEIVVTEDAYAAIATAFRGAQPRRYQLKGIARPVVAYALSHEQPLKLAI